MEGSPKLPRLHRRISRSKRWGRIALVGIVALALIFGGVLVQGLLLALDAGRWGLVLRAAFGLALLAGLVVFSVVLVRRQHVVLEEARSDLEEMIRGGPHSGH